METHQHHYAIIAKDRDDVQSFVRHNNLTFYQYTWIQSPLQLKGMYNTTVVFINGWRTNFNKAFIDLLTKEAFYCGKRPNNDVRMVHAEERIVSPQPQQQSSTLCYDNNTYNTYGDLAEEHY